MKFYLCQRRRFVFAMKRARASRPKLAPYMTLPTDFKGLFYLNDIGTVGYWLQDDWLMGVFVHDIEKGHALLGQIVDDAAINMHGSRRYTMKISVFEPLNKMYHRVGFNEVSRIPFRAELAPPGFDLRLKPYVVYMIRSNYQSVQARYERDLEVWWKRNHDA